MVLVFISILMCYDNKSLILVYFGSKSPVWFTFKISIDRNKVFVVVLVLVCS